MNLDDIKVPFNVPCYTGNEDRYVLDALRNPSDKYIKKCEEWFEKRFKCKRALLTSSCTHALEIIAILLDIEPGDEIIMPSYAFASVANAFAIFGARIVFVDIDPKTMNIDPSEVEKAISPRTKAICVIHYGGVPCQIDKIIEISEKSGVYVIEDSAHAINSRYNGKYAGTTGTFGCFSFHYTKNCTSAGQGGLLIINDEKFIERAEIVRERGTTKPLFLKGVVEEYTWVDKGSNFAMSNVNAAYLWGQLELIDQITKERLSIWNYYKTSLAPLEGKIELMSVPSGCEINGHMFFIKTKDEEERKRLINFLREQGIQAETHYVPLHSSPAGRRFGEFRGEDRFTTRESRRLLRLPIFYNMTLEQMRHVVESIYFFYDFYDE